ncbi:hypothetical protein AGOR_G00088280 [Albula goreensis]|uniref:BUB1 N-terminal domain-containing protein n=1 Tax=Albula goreensis TaxID=1534307 RepID=A0A8T3DL14_9TELE|nr:hypothetical protein AGOR_G00088280 [Albula goreensis]
MAEEGGVNWECQGNNRPMRQGLLTSSIHPATPRHKGSAHSAHQEQRQYLTWTLQIFPQGGKESNLCVLLERAVMQLVDEKKYHNDARYVHLWIKLAENSTDPLDVYSYMHAEKIGDRSAVFYIAWSEELEKRGDSEKVDAIYQDGIKCKAEPIDSLLRAYKNFQVRTSHQVMSATGDKGKEKQSSEELSPQETSLTDRKLRGKKGDTPCPLNKKLGHRQSLSLQLPAAALDFQTNLLATFNENQSEIPNADLFGSKSGSWKVRPSSRANESDRIPEQQTSVKKLPQSPADRSSGDSFPRKLDPPLVDEVDQPPATSGRVYANEGATCEGNRGTDAAFSPPKRRPEATPPVGARPREQSMYLKEPLQLNGATELCFEEVRAWRYQQRATLELAEKEAKLKREKEELKLQIEEKERLLQRYINQTTTQCTPGPAPAVPSVVIAVPSVHDGSSSTSPLHYPGFPDQDKDIGSDDVFLSPLPKEVFNFGPFLSASDGGALKIQEDRCASKFSPFTIFDESSTCEPSRAVAPVPVRHKVTRKALAVIRKPTGDGSPKEPVPENHAVGRTESPNDPTLVSSNQSEMLFQSPEGTGDFASLAQLASTPLRPGTSEGTGLALPKSPCDLPTDTPKDESAKPTTTPRQKKLSPIQEATLEDGCSTSSSSSSVGSLATQNNSYPTSELEPAQCDSNPMSETEMVDPCSARMRRQLLGEVDLSSYPGFHRKEGNLPSINEYDVLSLDDEIFIIKCKINSGENHTFCLETSKMMTIKVDFQSIPWDFYVACQLRKRLTSDSSRRHCDHTSCFLYDDGYITVTRGSCAGTLQELLDRSELPRNIAAFLVMELLELVEQMHACHLVHGDLRPHTLMLFHWDEFERATKVLRALDSSCCVDLDLQPEVTSCRGLPASRAYLRQGILSPSSSPYQVDLIGIAETVHVMLKKQEMRLVEEDSEWKPAENWESSSGDGVAWQRFFRKILNPGTRSSVAVLSELRRDLETHFKLELNSLSAFFT